MDYVVNSIFRNAWSPEPVKDVHFLHILNSIMSDKHRDTIEHIRNAETKESRAYYKKKLVSFTPCGTFHGKRHRGNLAEYSSVIVLDIDDLSITKSEFIKQVMKRDPNISAAFISPSGGLKVFMQISTADPKMHKEAFEQCKEYVEDKYAGYHNFKVDPSGKDYTRLCFVSWDPNAFYNPDSVVFEIDENRHKYREENFVEVITHKEGLKISTKEIFERCIKMIKKSKIGPYRAGNRNNFVYCLAMKLNEYGVPYETALNNVALRYASLGYEEVKTTVRSAYKRKSIHGTKFMVSYKSNPQQQSLI